MPDTPGQRALNVVLEATVNALNEFSEVVMGAAQLDAPLDEGPLRESAVLVEAEKPEPPILPGDLDVEAQIVFNKEYAAIQHERRDFRHTDGKSHYLEDAVNSMAGGGRMERYIGERVERRLRQVGIADA